MAPRRRLTVPDVRGTSSTPISESAPRLVQVKLSTSSLSSSTAMLMMRIASRAEVVLSIQIGVAEGEAERVRSVETEVVEEAVGSVDEVPTASLPSVPPQLQLVQLCLQTPHGTDKTNNTLASR